MRKYNETYEEHGLRVVNCVVRKEPEVSEEYIASISKVEEHAKK
jgi:hypothetical protein